MIRSKVEAWFEDLNEFCADDTIQSPSSGGYSAVSSFVVERLQGTNQTVGGERRRSSKERELVSRSSVRQEDGITTERMKQEEEEEEEEEMEDNSGGWEGFDETTQSAGGIRKCTLTTNAKKDFSFQEVEEKENHEKRMDVEMDQFYQIPMTEKHVADVHRFELPPGTVPILEFVTDSMTPRTGDVVEWKDSLGGMDTEDLRRREEIDKVVACVSLVAARLMEIIDIEKSIADEEERGVRMVRGMSRVSI